LALAGPLFVRRTGSSSTRLRWRQRLDGQRHNRRVLWLYKCDRAAVPVLTELLDDDPHVHTVAEALLDRALSLAEFQEMTRLGTVQE
jgi:hypothetical protein